MTASVTLLGVKGGPAIAPGSAMPTSSLVRLGARTVLIDAGLGAAAGVVRAGVSLTEIDAVLITHLHSDHYLELGPLLHTAWTSGLTRPVPIHGPPGLADYWRAFLASMAYDIDTRIADEGRPELAPLFPLHVVEEGATVEIGNLHVTALHNDHPPVTGSFAFRLEADGRAVVFSGDTAPMAEMAGFARGADLLVHEAILPDRIEALVARLGHGDPRLLAHILRSHSAAPEVGRIAEQAGVRALALNHLIPVTASEADWRAAVSGTFDGTLLIGTDGMRIDLGELP